jgi:hypothetical protein
MDSKHFYRFSYAVQRKGDRRLPPHQMRDGEAFAELSPVLTSLGYEYGGNFLNFPARHPADKTEVDISFLKREDILVITTRPPLNDEQEGYKKKVIRSHTSLEDEVFDVLTHYFTESTRTYIKLSPYLAAKLPKGFANRAYIEFEQYVGAKWTARKGISDSKWEKPNPPERTVGYLLQTPSFKKGIPQILAVFGMGGIETLVFAYFLRKRFRHELELDRPRFAMVEMICEEIPEKPTSLSFADKWHAEIFFTVFLKDAPPNP